MAKRRMLWDEDHIKTRIKEGYGSGKGHDYKPWLDTYSLSSKGVSSRQPGWKSNRVCHFLSNNELHYFYLLEWSDMVVDTKEQYPLLDLEETIEIAQEIGVKHPTEVKSKTPFVLTTDFLITVNDNGKEHDIARTIKMAADLENIRVLEKFEIERKYWMKEFASINKMIKRRECV